MPSGTPPVHSQDQQETPPSLEATPALPAIIEGTTTTNFLTLSPNGSTNGSSASSRASSVRGGSTTSTLSESGESVSSLGGLNHVNDGVGGSTAQRRMSRAYSADDFTARRVSVDYLRPSTTTDGLTQQQYQSQGQTATAPPLIRPRRHSTTAALDEELAGKRESCWKTWLRRRVPAFGWLISPGYSLQDLPDDLIAGISKVTMA